MKEINAEMDDINSIMGALGNITKRSIIYYIGSKKECLGGSDELILPMVDCAKKCGYSLNPASIPPKLSELRTKDGIVQKSKNGFWHLTERGKNAYAVLEWMGKNVPHSSACNMVIEKSPVLDALGNSTKRIIIMYFGRYGKRKGGMKEIVSPIVEVSARMGKKLNPFSIPPKLTELKNKNGILDLDKNSFWHLTGNGMLAYSLLEYVARMMLKKELMAHMKGE